MGGSHSRTAVVHGTVLEGYESVRDLFKKNVETGREREAQLCVFVEGEKVVDLWGSADGDVTYTGDSLQCVFSSSKAVTAIALAQLAQRGFLNYNVPVANYWPEFGQNLKSLIRIEDILRHEGGIPRMATPLTLDDILPVNLTNGVIADALAKLSPVMPVNTPREYHQQTAGLVMNELFHRLSPNKDSLGSWVRREISQPLNIDVYLGLNETELGRVRDLTGLSENYALLQSLLPNYLGGQVDHNILVFSKMLSSFKKKFLPNKDRGPDVVVGNENDPSDLSGDFVAQYNNFFNNSKWRQGESPHGSVHASARGLAKLASAMSMGGTFEGIEVLSKDGWELLHRNPVVQKDEAMGGCRTEFTQGGVNVFTDYPDDRMPERILKSGRHGFVGWMGFGGSVMQWHPGAKMGFGYTCTLLTWWDLANTKARKLQKEAMRCAVLQQDKQTKQEPVDLNNNKEIIPMQPVTDLPQDAEPVVSA